MTMQITPQDWDALSAYLDNALNPREQQRLETQLQARPDFRAALHELRQTRALLRNTPTLRAPRNFTLTPQMAGERAMRPRSYPLFRLAFTLASIFLLFTFAGELTVGRFTPASLPAQDVALVESMAAEAPAPAGGIAEEEQRVMMESVPMEPGAEEPPAEEAFTTMGATDDTGMTDLPDTNGENQTPSPEESLQYADLPTLTPEAMTKDAPEIVEEPAPAMEPFAYPDPYAYDPQADTANSTGLAPDMREDTKFPSLWDSPWRVWQVIFGSVVILSGLALLFMRRAR